MSRPPRTPRAVPLVLLGAALLLLTATQCGSVPVIRISSPPEGLGATYEPLTLEVDFWAFAGAETFEVLLNGVDITSDFEVGEPVGYRCYATALDVWGAGLVNEGSNELVVRVGGWETTRSFSTEGDPYADAVESFVPGVGAGYGQTELPGVVTGAPSGLGLFQGGLDVLSLGAGGVVVLEFVDNVIVDGPGVDFTVFENPFLTLVSGVVGPPFAEPGLVSVSQDGVDWVAFDACATDPLEDPLFPGCAGVFPTLYDPLVADGRHPSIPTETPIGDLVGLPQSELFVPEGSGGDSFDLADVGLAWARYVKIEDVGPALGQSGTIGFDLDAVAAVSSAVATDADMNGVPDAVE